MRASEFIIENASEIVSASDDGKTITIKVRAPDGTLRSIANSNPAVVQQWLNLKYGLRLPHSIARKFVGMPAAMAEQDIDEDISRRGFLKGAGAAAVAGAAGSAMSQSAEEKRAEALRRENLARMQGMHRATQTGQDTDKNYSKDVSYGHKISRRIKPNLTFPHADLDKMEGNPEAIVEIRCAPDGTILSRKLTKSSGNTEWDQAVIRAIDKSESMPQDVDGKVPSPITISVRPLSESVNQGVAEKQLDEKSTSQAQFRTMAAAAHNPKFARKVGISQSVAKEFHGADRGSDYKKLPKKTAEGEIDEVLGFVISRPKQNKKPETSLAAMRKEFEKDKSGQIEKTAQGRGAPAVVKYVRKTTDEDASWGMAPESQGHR